MLVFFAEEILRLLTVLSGLLFMSMDVRFDFVLGQAAESLPACHDLFGNIR